MATDQPLPIAPNGCPLCGAINHCAVAAGHDPKGCWCMSVTVPADLLESLPTATAGRACICEACVEAWNTRGVRRRYTN